MMADSKIKPDSAWSWVVCMAASVTLTIINGSFSSFGLLMPYLMTHFGQNNVTTAWTGSLYISLSYIFAPVVTHFTGRLGFRLTALSGALLLSTSFFACSFIKDFWLFFVFFSITSGLGSAMSHYSATLVVLRHFVRWRFVVVGILASTLSVGMFVITQITEALLSKYGLQNALRGWAFLFLSTVPLACTYISRSNDTEEIARQDEENLKQPSHDTRRPSLLRNFCFMIYLTSISLVFFSAFIPGIYMVKFCESELNISMERASLLYTYMASASFFSNHFFCNLSKFEFKFFDIFELYQLTTTCFGICLLLLPLARSYSAMVAFSMLFGFMDGGRYGLMPLLVLECVGLKRTEEAWGYIAFSVGFTSCIGPVIIGFIADSVGRYGPAFLTAGGIFVLGSTLMFLRELIGGKDSSEENLESGNESFEFLVYERETVL